MGRVKKVPLKPAKNMWFRKRLYFTLMTEIYIKVISKEQDCSKTYQNADLAKIGQK